VCTPALLMAWMPLPTASKPSTKPLAQIVASGKVEMVKDTNGEKIEDLSIMAIRELFTLGARDALACYNEIRNTDFLCSDFILPASAAEIAAAMTFAAVIGNMRDPVEAGPHYAAAALAFGIAGQDPSFEAAAAVYVSTYPHCGMTAAEYEHMMAQERLLGQLWSCRSMRTDRM
jgi:hypothetical protein